MPGALTIGINKTKTYRLVATGRKGSVTKNIKVYVRDKKCKLTVSITGTNKKHTDGIRIYKEVKGKRNELLFTRPVNVLRKNKHISYSSTILLSSGRYYLTPYGNGKSKRGNFRVLHKPRGFSYSCKGGNTKNITINAIGHKY